VSQQLPELMPKKVLLVIALNNSKLRLFLKKNKNKK